AGRPERPADLRHADALGLGRDEDARADQRGRAAEQHDRRRRHAGKPDVLAGRDHRDREHEPDDRDDRRPPRGRAGVAPSSGRLALALLDLLDERDRRRRLGVSADDRVAGLEPALHRELAVLVDEDFVPEQPAREPRDRDRTDREGEHALRRLGLRGALDAAGLEHARKLAYGYCRPAVDITAGPATTLAELEAAARARLPGVAWDYYAG